MKFLKLLILALIFMTATSDSAFSQTSSADQKSESLQTVVINVKGITCSTDLKIISNNVEKLQGVRSCIPGKKGTTTTFDVKYEPELVTEKEIFSAVENSGSCENPNERPYKIRR